MAQQRLKSLDMLRGFTVAGMILVNNGYGESFQMLRHSQWNGMTPCDLVFPFFLFMMGVSCYLSLTKTSFTPSRPVLWRVVKRAVLLFAIGLFINWFELAVKGQPLDFAHLRIWAVMQRIALCYLFVSLFALYCNHRFVLPSVAVLLTVYSAILLLGNGYAEDASTNILARVDLNIFGYDHLYHKSPVDPEGLVGTISAVAHTLIGFYCGKLLKEKNFPLKLFAFGTVCIIAGYLLTYGLPLNKRVWSPSYVLVSSGLSTLMLALFIYMEQLVLNEGDCRQPRSFVALQRGLFRFFRVFGVNALAIYVCSELLSILFGHFGISDAIYSLFNFSFIPLKWASLAYSLVFVGINYLIGLVLWKRHILIKL